MPPAMFHGIPPAGGKCWPPLRELLARVPSMPGALCVGNRGGLPASAWDAEADPADTEAARALCYRCPELAACRAWALSPGGGAPRGGIVAGMTGPEREAARRYLRDTDTLGVDGQVSAYC